MNLFLDAGDMKEYLYSSETEDLLGIIRKRFIFPNGYGASVIAFAKDIGAKENLWEVAVLCFSEDSNAYHITYHTPITDDVLSNLTESEVADVLHEIFELEPIV